MDLGHPRLFRWDELPMEAVTDMLSRKIITGEKVMAGQVWLKQGCVVPQHSHEAEQCTIMFSGALKFIIGGETMVVGPGQMLVIPPWVKHEALAVEDTYEMDVFAPIRWDWLEKTDSYFTQRPTQAADFTNPATAANPARLIRWDEIPAEAVTPLIDRRYESGDRATVAMFRLRRGGIVPTHQHEAEQLTWVRSGRLRFVVGTEHFEVTGDSVLRIPSNVPHSAEAIEDSEATDMFSPRREDWITKNDQYLRGVQR